VYSSPPPRIRPDAELIGQVGSGSEIIILDPDPDLTLFDKKICITFANFSSKWTNAFFITHIHIDI
jgi:hypothetical protein